MEGRREGDLESREHGQVMVNLATDCLSVCWWLARPGLLDSSDQLLPGWLAACRVAQEGWLAAVWPARAEGIWLSDGKRFIPGGQQPLSQIAAESETPGPQASNLQGLREYGQVMVKASSRGAYRY